MRPRPSEIVAGIRAVLADTIAPELTSEHARSRLAEIRAVLAQVDWDNTSFALENRCGRLAAALAEAERWTHQQQSEFPTDRNFDAYQRYWEQLGTQAVIAHEALSAYIAAHPDDKDAHSAYEELLNTL